MPVPDVVEPWEAIAEVVQDVLLPVCVWPKVRDRILGMRAGRNREDHDDVVARPDANVDASDLSTRVREALTNLRSMDALRDD